MADQDIATSPRRQWLSWAVAGCAAAAGLGLAWRRSGPAAAVSTAGAAASGPAAAASVAPLEGVDALWALSVARPEGGELALASLKGKPLVINFWATWCAPCVHEMPEIDRFHKAYSTQGWQVLGLAIDGPTPVREYLARVKVGFPIGLAGLDGTDLIRALGNPQGVLPFTVVINPQGQIVQRKIGETSLAELSGWAGKA